MKLSNFMNSLLTNLIPPKISKLVKISSLKFMFGKAISLLILHGFQQMRAQNLSKIMYNSEIVTY